jgi:hypothetical protein
LVGEIADLYVQDRAAYNEKARLYTQQYAMWIKDMWIWITALQLINISWFEVFGLFT